MKRRFAVIPLLVVLITPITTRSAWAQSAQATSGVSALATRLTPGDLVRVKLRSGARVDGSVVEVTADVVRVNPTTRIPVPVRDLALADIDSIELRHEGRSPGKKVLRGVAIGAAVIGGIAIVVVLKMIEAAD